MTYDVVEGTSNVLQFQLLENGIPVSLGGFTITLLLEDRTGTALVSPGTVSVIDNTTGKVQFAPTSTSVFVASAGPYYARWKLTSGGGLVSYVPSSNRDVWVVVGQ